LEAPDDRGIGIDEYNVSTNGHCGYRLLAVPHGRVGLASVDDLELVAMHVPWMAAGVEIVDHNFDADRVSEVQWRE
jgi:hypothetical protein